MQEIALYELPQLPVGSALNVCPLKTTSCLGLSIEDFLPTD